MRTIVVGFVPGQAHALEDLPLGTATLREVLARDLAASVDFVQASGDSAERFNRGPIEEEAQAGLPVG